MWDQLVLLHSADGDRQSHMLDWGAHHIKMLTLNGVAHFRCKESRIVRLHDAAASPSQSLSKAVP